MEERPPTPLEPASPSPPRPPPPSPPSPPPPPAAPAEPPPIPWEQPGLDAFTAFFQTASLLLSSPRKAFERMPVTPRFGRPLVFALIVGLVGVWADAFWNLVLYDRLEELAPWADKRWEISTASKLLAAVTALVWLPLVLLIASGLQHLFLMLVGGARRGFAATFRTQCYAWVTMPLAIIPMCGQIVGVIWGVVLMIIGLSAAHRITTGRAAAAVLLPLVLCCGCVALALALFGAAIFGALGSRM